jgi:hypothetical protein
MAAFAGTYNVLATLALGNRKLTLVQINVTNYNHTTGIPLLPPYVGMGTIEAVFSSVNGIFNTANSPCIVAYSPADAALFCYVTGDLPVSDDTNIFANNGPIMLLVVGV